MTQSSEFPQFQWIEPAAWTSGRGGGPPLWVVLHYTAGAEGPTSAEDGAAYDARRPDGTSCHFFVDQNSVVQCVRTSDIAHSALYNGNLRGIHLELCGTAQTRAQWLDAASRPTIRNAAQVAALCMAKWGIDGRRLGVAEVAGRSATGYCDHGTITAAFPGDGGDHMDVGEGFPWDVFASDLADYLEGTDMSAQSDEILAAMANGNPKLSSGGVVAPVVWRIRDEAWQQAVTASLARDEARDAAMATAITGLTAAIKAGGGSVDSVAITTAIRESAQQVGDRIHAELVAQAAREAKAAQAEADALKI